MSNALVNAAWASREDFSDAIFPAKVFFSARKSGEDAAVFVDFED